MSTLKERLNKLKAPDRANTKPKRITTKNKPGGPATPGAKKARIAALEKGRQRLAFDMTKEKDPKRRASMKKHGENMTADIRRLRGK